MTFAESTVEQAALAWLESLGYAVLHGPQIAAGTLAAEQDDPNNRDVVLDRRLRQALVCFNIYGKREQSLHHWMPCAIGYLHN